jgi:hypothetical protein
MDPNMYVADPSHLPPDYRPFAAPVPRISGSAMPSGVFLSAGTAGTASAPELAATGMAILVVGTVAMVPVYCIAWLLEQWLQVPLAPLLLQVGGPSDPTVAALARIGLNILGFLSFLVVLRFTPLAGHHAAEHMTVHAIERFGTTDWEVHVAEMPRAHPRCGSNLLAGILPVMLIAVPLLSTAPLLSLAVAVLGWSQRQRIGFMIQNVFTTRPPSPAELARGVSAGRRVLAAWAAAPPARLTVAQRLWLRGMPQLVAGVVVGMWLLGAVADHLHFWLDW